MRGGDMNPLLQTIVDRVHPPQVEIEDPFQLQVSQLDYNSYQGVIGIGRIARGRIKSNSQVVVVDATGKRRNARILQLYGFLGLERIEVANAQAGNIVSFTGVDGLRISDTLCDPNAVEALAPLSV
ncbi:MAG: GTP-binding protein, partial [Halothiobacillaceae bacterium]